MNPDIPHPAADTESPASVLSPSSRASAVRWLHAITAFVLLVLTFLGFRAFYMQGQAYPGPHPIPPPLRGLIIAHGVSVSLWILLSVVQPVLIATNNRRLHMALGKAGGVLAAVILVIALQVPIAAARVEPDVTLWHLDRIHFTAVSLLSIVTFGGFVTAGLIWRRKPATHRAMMLMATLAILGAATDRIASLPPLYQNTFMGTLFGPVFPELTIGAVFILVRWALTRRFDRPLVKGLAVLAFAAFLIMRIAPTDAWGRIASWLVS